MRLLIIGTLEGQIGAASRIARERGAEVAQADDIDAALELVRSGQGAELILMEARGDIPRLIASLRAEHINVPVVACGLNASSSDAVRAIKAGAMEFLPFPPDAEMIAAVLEAIADEQQSLVVSSPAMQQVLELAERIAPSDASVLITGESGTGKEVMARFIHEKSRRAQKRFVSVNCAAIPDNLLESELFGHEKGAFTGAVARRVGKFEEASGGTLLLDEISEMELRLQSKLLRAIQEREIDRVGGTAPVKVDLRILATSNRNLPDYVAEGKFREDLFFRLNVITLHLPPLRERQEDIPALARHFAARYSELNHLSPRHFGDKALAMLKAHPWPGNVRELENTVHRAVLLARGEEIDPSALMLTPPRAAAGEVASKSHVGRTVASVERDLILETLDHCMGNRTKAATILGISIRTLRNKLQEYGRDVGEE
jgi:two-component system response regulator FlrC